MVVKELASIYLLMSLIVDPMQVWILSDQRQENGNKFGYFIDQDIA